MEQMKKKDSISTRFGRHMRKNWIYYVMLAVPMIYFIIYHYWPMYGLLMAFKDYKIKLGIIESPWVGFEHFIRFFESFRFWDLIRNTLTLSVYALLVGFPIPIIFALMLHYLKKPRLKKTVQMVSYAPHFISTVVICSMITIFMTKDSSIFNVIRGLFGMEPVNFLAKESWFKHIYVWSEVWQSCGWDAIIYLSALSGVDYSLHEAAIIDGATKIQRMRYVDLPSIKPTVVMLLILRVGSMASIGFEKVFLLQNDLNMNAASVISTYVYEVGLIQKDYGYSAAVGLFNTIINVILLLLMNQFSKKVLKESLL